MESSLQSEFNSTATLACLIVVIYLLLVQRYRYERTTRIMATFGSARPLSSMTTNEAHDILTQLQELEFPWAFNKARTIALLKAGGIPTMSKLFAVTGQNNRRNAGKRAIDTEILLRESQTQRPDSERYAKAVARMNFLHSRYRQAGKILDNDLLHTLGSGVVEALRIVEEQEWRNLSDVEVCAIGIFHKNLGEDMGIPLATMLPSGETGWRDGKHFAEDLRDWTVRYEESVAVPTATNDQYVRVYVDSAVSKFPQPIVSCLRKSLGAELSDTMRESLGLESPGVLLSWFLGALRGLRKLYLRYLNLPRPAFLAVEHVSRTPNATTGLFNYNHSRPQPWYVSPSFWNTWGPIALFVRAMGGRLPGSSGDKYHPKGYDLWTIGPAPQEGKGLDEMKQTVQSLQARDLSRCPFTGGIKLEVK